MAQQLKQIIVSFWIIQYFLCTYRPWVDNGCTVFDKIT